MKARNMLHLSVYLRCSLSRRKEFCKNKLSACLSTGSKKGFYEKHKNLDFRDE